MKEVSIILVNSADIVDVGEQGGKDFWEDLHLRKRRSHKLKKEIRREGNMFSIGKYVFCI